MTKRVVGSMTSRGLLALAEKHEFTTKEFTRNMKREFDSPEQAIMASNEMQVTGLTERIVRLTDKGRAALQIVKELSK